MLAPARKVIKDTIAAPARKVTKDTITSNSPSAISELHKLPKTKDTDVWFLRYPYFPSAPRVAVHC